MKKYIQLPRMPSPPSRLEVTEIALKELIDLMMTIHALAIEKNIYTWEEFNRMSQLVVGGRHKLGGQFTMEQGIKAIQAAFRIEISRDKPDGKSGA